MIPSWIRYKSWACVIITVAAVAVAAVHDVVIIIRCHPSIYIYTQ